MRYPILRACAEIAILISLALLFLAAPSLAESGQVNTTDCIRCHSAEISQSGINTGCGCHTFAHGAEDGKPSQYSSQGRKTIHALHSGSITNQKGCTTCHTKPACSACHYGHKSIKDKNVSRNCESCHGQLPEPKGHTEQRATFKESMHGWMNSCSACHVGDKLHFKDIVEFDFNQSSQFCYICHSKQYTDASHDSGRAADRDCVECHNPHGEKNAGFGIALPPVEGVLGGILGSITDFVNNNPVLVIIALVLIAAVIFELILTPGKGQVVLAKTLKIEHEKAKTKALRVEIDETVESSAMIVSEIGTILNRRGTGLLGMVKGKQDIVLFLSDVKDGLIEEVKAVGGVKNAEFSDEYEV